MNPSCGNQQAEFASNTPGCHQNQNPSRTWAGLDASGNSHGLSEGRGETFFLTSPFIGSPFIGSPFIGSPFIGSPYRKRLGGKKSRSTRMLVADAHVDRVLGFFINHSSSPPIPPLTTS